jgi:hypothetical protein
MEATSTPPKRIAVGNVVSETFSIYGDQFGPLVGSAFVVLVLVGVVSGLLFAAGGVVLDLIGLLVAFAGRLLYVGFVVKLVDDVRDGRRDSSVGDLFSAAAPSILPLAGFAILAVIGVAIGLALLIIPGLILLTFWSVAAPAIVAERVGVFEAFGRSWHLVSGNAWSVFGALVVVSLIWILIGFVLGAIATPIGNGAIVVANILANVLTAPIFALAVSVMFFDLGGGAGAAAAAPAAPPAATEPPPPPPPPAS